PPSDGSRGDREAAMSGGLAWFAEILTYRAREIEAWGERTIDPRTFDMRDIYDALQCHPGLKRSALHELWRIVDSKDDDALVAFALAYVPDADRHEKNRMRD